MVIGDKVKVKMQRLFDAVLTFLVTCIGRAGSRTW